MSGRFRLLLGPRTPPVVLGPPPPGVFKLGTNLSGAENQYPQFPTLDEMTSAKNDLGLTTFRFPLCWSKANPQTSDGLTGVQHTVNGALDAGYLASINTVLGSAASLSMTALLDIHMFGGGPGGTVGSTAVPISAFADLWSKFATWCLGGSGGTNYPAAIRGLDLMNEWVNGTDSALVFNASQAAITAIRATGFTKPIYVEGTNYTGAWNWVTGRMGDGSIGYNNTGLNALVDPLNNLIFSAHCYLDNDNSGGGGPYDPNGGFGYAKEVSKNGVLGAPPGTVVGPNIGVIRISAFAAWLRAHGLRGHIGEFGVSNDIPAAGSNTQDGQYDSASWNVAADNALAYCQANNIELDYWGNGPGFGPSYSYFAGKTTADGKSKDFSAAGYQSSQAVILQKYSGWTGTQPTRYRLVPPLDSGFNPITRGVVGTASQPYRVIYNGKLTSSVTITPNDGGQGGTFSPASVTLAPGNNATATFTYTPAVAAQIFIATTNSAGWADPPSLICATQHDSFVSIVTAPTNVYGLRRLYASYTGHAMQLKRASDGAAAYFDFNAAGNLPRQAIQTWANSRSIAIVTLYDQSPAGNNITFNSGGAVLTLVNAQGYPEITVPSGTRATFNSPAIGQTQQTIIARLNRSYDGGYGFISQDLPTGPFNFGASGQYQILDNTGTYPTQGVSLGFVNGAWHNYAGTYQANISGGLKAYLDGALNGAAVDTPNHTLGAQYSCSTALGYFVNYAGVSWVGSFTNFVIFEGYAATLSQVAAFANDDASYYSTALPDTLSAVNPTTSGTAPTSVVQGSSDSPFAGVTIADTNSGTPTDSVSIALTGGAGTLTGTGLSGSGPYTIAAAAAASITGTLRALQWTPSGAAGSTTTFALTVTSSAGTSASDSATVVTVQAYVAETPYAAPSGTWTPMSGTAAFKGANIGGANNAYPSSSQYNYIYPQPREFDYLSSKGMGLIRMNVGSRRLYPVAFSLLDPINRSDEPAVSGSTPGTNTNLLAIKAALDYAFTKRMYVIIDNHDSDGHIYDSRSNSYLNAGDGSSGTALFADFWSRNATKYKNYPNVVFGLANEPAGLSAAQFKVAAVAALAAIRAAGATQLVLIAGGGNYDDAEPWASTMGTLWDTFNQPGWTGNNGDPANNFAFEGHKYLNAAGGGSRYGNDGQGTNYRNATGAQLLGGMTTWCRQTNGGVARANPFKAFLGETGWGPDGPAVISGQQAPVSGSAVPSVTSNSLLDFMSANSDVWLGWAFFAGGSWAFFGGYTWGHLVPQNSGGAPSGYVDQPQMAQLTAHL